MKVLLFSDVQRRGGAGIAAHRLARALIDHGHDVLWATPYPDTAPDVPTVNCREYDAAGRAARRVSLALQPGQKQAVETHAVVRKLRRVIRRFRPDVINVHNLHGAGLPATLPAELSRVVPVVWTLHDMWAFTGTCAYSMDCKAFESACHGECPMSNEYPSTSASRVPLLFAQRRQALAGAGRIGFSTPSAWLAEQAKHGMLAGKVVRAIPNSVDLGEFKPVDRDAAREALGLPTDRPVLVTTATPDDPRKGAAVLRRAMALLDRPNTIVLQLGGKAHGESACPWDHRVQSGLSDPRLLRLAYSAADAHVLPTLADNLPNTLLEASACGVPSIASDVGGVGEAVEHDKTGWLVTPGCAEQLAQRIADAIDQPLSASQTRRQECRRLAESRFSPGLQARRYSEIYSDVIAGNGCMSVSKEAA